MRDGAEPLMAVRTAADARAFVLSAVRQMTPKERNRTADEYLKMCAQRPKQQQRQKKRVRSVPQQLPPSGNAKRARAAPTPPPRRGGSKLVDADAAAFDARMRTLLFQVDRKHDFDTYVDADAIPREWAMDDGSGRKTVHGEFEFAKQCFRTAKVTFGAVGRAAMPNRMWIPKLKSRPQPIDAEDGRTLVLHHSERCPTAPTTDEVARLRARSEAWLASERGQDDYRIWHVDVWSTRGHARGRALRLTDVVRLIAAMREAFPAHESLIVDASTRSHVFQVVCALRLIDDAFFRTYVVVDDDADGDEISASVQALRDRVARRLKKGAEWVRDEWRVVYSDATVFDSGDWPAFLNTAVPAPPLDEVEEQSGPPPALRPRLLTPHTAPLGSKSDPDALVVVDRSATGDVFPPSFGVGVRLGGLAKGRRVKVEIRDGERGVKAACSTRVEQAGVQQAVDQEH